MNVILKIDTFPFFWHNDTSAHKMFDNQRENFNITYIALHKQSATFHMFKTKYEYSHRKQKATNAEMPSQLDFLSWINMLFYRVSNYSSLILTFNYNEQDSMYNIISRFGDVLRLHSICDKLMVVKLHQKRFYWISLKFSIICPRNNNQEIISYIKVVTSTVASTKQMEYLNAALFMTSTLLQSDCTHAE